MTTTRLLSSSGVAERLGISRQTVPQWVASGKLEPVGKIDGPSGAYVFDVEQIDRLAAARAAALTDELERLTAEAAR